MMIFKIPTLWVLCFVCFDTLGNEKGNKKILAHGQDFSITAELVPECHEDVSS